MKLPCLEIIVSLETLINNLPLCMGIISTYLPKRLFTYLDNWDCQKSLKALPITFPAPLIQCDQMVRLFFNIWSFAPMKISPIASQICQNRLSILPNKKYTVKKLPKTCILLPKRQNFTKSGHTVPIPFRSGYLLLYLPI